MHVQRLVSVVKMVTVHEECALEEKHSDMLFLWAKGLNAKDIYKEMFTVESVCHIKQFPDGSRNCQFGNRHFTDDEEVETEVQKWLRQQSKDFYDVGFYTLVKR
jgi:hypothetical protein